MTGTRQRTSALLRGGNDGGAAFCEEYVALLEAIRDALVGIDDEPMSTVRAMAEQAIEGDPEGAALDMRTYANQRRALQGESALEGLPDEEQPE
ncbi:MAG TPA: hypothetical protein VJ140_10795 [Actinomycetota bacterium]|nr:hypothetical protein [Actinomycetota bacterium]